MNVAEFITDLSNDELSDMFVGNRNNAVENRGKLLPLINKAMLQAYAKYMISWSSVMITVTSDVKTYDLTDIAISDPALDPLAVLEVLNSYGRALEPHECRVQGNILYFPNPDNVELEVVYKLKPTRFIDSQVDEDTEILMPPLLIPWMSSWVAGRYFLGQKDEGARAKGAELLTLAGIFEESFNGTNTTNENTHEDNSKLCYRGFP